MELLKDLDEYNAQIVERAIQLIIDDAVETVIKQDIKSKKSYYLEDWFDDVYSTIPRFYLKTIKSSELKNNTLPSEFKDVCDCIKSELFTERNTKKASPKKWIDEIIKEKYNYLFLGSNDSDEEYYDMMDELENGEDDPVDVLKRYNY